MAVITLSDAQAQFLTSMETTISGAFEDGVIVPGGTPPLLPPFDGYKDYTVAQKTLGLNSLKTTFTPFLVSMGSAPTYTTVTVFENGFGTWGDGNYGNGVLRYTKGIDGYVHIHGLIRTPASGPTISLVAFTLPTGYCPGPNNNSIFACVADNLFCAVEVNGAGQVSLRSSPANNTWVSLEIRYFVGG